MSDAVVRYLLVPPLVVCLAIWVKGTATRRRGPRGLDDRSVWVELLLGVMFELLLLTLERSGAIQAGTVPAGELRSYQDFGRWAPWTVAAMVFLLWGLSAHVGKHLQSKNRRFRFVQAFVYPHVAALVALAFSFWLISR